MNRVISYGLKAREELAKGADFLADAVRSTLGPFGENWFLDSNNTITNDGVTIAREIQFSVDSRFPDGSPMNEFNNRGATALKQAAEKTVNEAGDGTTTAIILAQAIYHECARLLPTEGVLGKISPSEIRKRIDSEKDDVIAQLKALSTPITTEQQLIDSATVSMGDSTFGEMIGKAQWKLGPDGIIMPEESNDAISSIEYVKGVMIDNGFGTSLIVTNQERQTLEVEDVKVLLTSYTMKDIRDWVKLKNIFDQLHKSGVTQVAVIARAWTEETIRMCLENINKGALKIYPLSAPYINMAQRMKDLEALTGARYFDSESTRLEDMNITDAGHASRIVARRMDAIVTGDDSAETNLRTEHRLKELQDEHKGSESPFERTKLSERIAQLDNGLARLKVCAQSEMERSRLFDKCDDAVHAVRAAYQEGTVPGAGLAFKDISDKLPSDSLLKRPLLTINQQIVSSAPKDFVIEPWVRDPLKVLRIALDNACATASSFALAGGVVTNAWRKSLDSLFAKEQSL